MSHEDALKFIRKLMDKTNAAQLTAAEMTKKEMKKVLAEFAAKPGSGSWDRK